MPEMPIDIAKEAAALSARKLAVYEIIREKVAMLRDDLAHTDTSNPTIYDLYQHLDSLHQKMREAEEPGQ